MKMNECCECINHYDDHHQKDDDNNQKDDDNHQKDDDHHQKDDDNYQKDDAKSCCAQIERDSITHWLAC